LFGSILIFLGERIRAVDVFRRFGADIEGACSVVAFGDSEVVAPSVWMDEIATVP
jgi:hypothetical protein